MMLLNISLLRTVALGGALLIAAFSASHSSASQSDAKTINQPFASITLLQNQTMLSYSQEVRFSQVLSEAYGQLNADVYTLGSALINPNKQHVVEEQKQAVLAQLGQLNTPTALYLAQQIQAIPFVFQEPLNSDFNAIRIQPKLDPIIQGEYWLSLPKRPNHITLINAEQMQNKTLPHVSHADLRDYLSTRHASAWIIQADRSVYQAQDLQWKSTLYFLSPGAMVFIGLPNLPDAYRDLNATIAQLLAFRLEL